MTQIQQSGNSSGPKLVLQLSSDISAHRDGENLGAPPNQSVAALALLLQKGAGRPLHRSMLAAQVYPDSDREQALTALRQAFLRLRSWLGQGVVEGTYHEIRPLGVWNLEVTPPLIGSVAAGMDHPVFVQLRRSLNPSSDTSAKGVLSQFIKTIREVSALDVDEARAMMGVSPGLVFTMPPSLALQLFELTRVRSRRDPFAFEHMELLALVLLHGGEAAQAEMAALRAQRIAVHGKRNSQVFRAWALQLFIAIETGSMPLARELLERLQSHPSRPQLLSENAQAAYEWNTGDLSNAILRMQRCRGATEGESRADRLHFWSNAAALASEARDESFYAMATDSAKPLLIDSHDRHAREVLETAHWLNYALRDPLEAAHQLGLQSARLREEGRWILSIYAAETRVLVLVRMGELSQAHNLWRMTSALRSEKGWKLTPRLRSIKPQS